MDTIDKQILKILAQNSKLTNKQIGELVHMTGQAVGNRIINLQEQGIIQKFSIKLNYSHTQFIRIFMDSNKYTEFERCVNSFEEVSALYKVSGQACYMILSHFTETKLARFIEQISRWGRYSVETVIADKTTHI
ncbi:Lrp/AsnC family transcriptional regulator [Liquorilactobacillus capillatus]|nr:AsnC family transcriptional regulator [Liquorilactobacillus capillatus]